MNGFDDLDMVTEDASHVPSHQSICLKHGRNALRSGGTYVLEDVHTSHPSHDQYRQEFGERRGQTALSVLLGIAHMRRIGVGVDDDRLLALARGSHFNLKGLRSLFAQIDVISLYRRATVPTSCWNCGSTRFDYHEMKCVCGIDLFAEADSITIVIKKR